MNLHRRHLSESQRAMIAARLPAFEPGHVATQKDKVVDLETERGGAEISAPQFTNQQAGDLMKINKATVAAAKTVLHEGTPEEIAAVDSGKAAVRNTAKHIRKRLPRATTARSHSQR